MCLAPIYGHFRYLNGNTIPKITGTQGCNVFSTDGVVAAIYVSAEPSDAGKQLRARIVLNKPDGTTYTDLTPAVTSTGMGMPEFYSNPIPIYALSGAWSFNSVDILDAVTSQVLCTSIGTGGVQYDGNCNVMNVALVTPPSSGLNKYIILGALGVGAYLILTR